MWLAASKFKSLSHVLGGTCYVGGGVCSALFLSWWPLFISYGFAFIIRRVFGDPHRASSSTTRSYEYKELSLIIGYFYTTNAPSISDIDLKQAEDEVFYLIEKDNELRKIFESQGFGINELRKIYTLLIEVGVGQWTKSEWLPLAAVATPITLSYLVKELANEDLDDNYFCTTNKRVKNAAISVLHYFEEGEPLLF